MTTVFHLSAKPQYLQRNRNYPYNDYWCDSTTPAATLSIHAESFDEAEEKAKRLLKQLPSGWRHKTDIISVDTSIDPEPAPTPTMLTRGPKGFRYKGV